MTATLAAEAASCRVSFSSCGRVSNRIAGEGHCFALPGRIGERKTLDRDLFARGRGEREKERGVGGTFNRLEVIFVTFNTPFGPRVSYDLCVRFRYLLLARARY